LRQSTPLCQSGSQTSKARDGITFLTLQSRPRMSQRTFGICSCWCLISSRSAGLPSLAFVEIARSGCHGDACRLFHFKRMPAPPMGLPFGSALRVRVRPSGVPVGLVHRSPFGANDTMPQTSMIYGLCGALLVAGGLDNNALCNGTISNTCRRVWRLLIIYLF